MCPRASTVATLRRLRVRSYLLTAADWWRRFDDLRSDDSRRPSLLKQVADEAARNAHKNTVNAFREAGGEPTSEWPAAYRRRFNRRARRSVTSAIRNQPSAIHREVTP